MLRQVGWVLVEFLKQVLNQLEESGNEDGVEVSNFVVADVREVDKDGAKVLPNGLLLGQFQLVEEEEEGLKLFHIDVVDFHGTLRRLGGRNGGLCGNVFEESTSELEPDVLDGYRAAYDNTALVTLLLHLLLLLLQHDHLDED